MTNMRFRNYNEPGLKQATYKFYKLTNLQTLIGLFVVIDPFKNYNILEFYFKVIKFSATNSYFISIHQRREVEIL